MFLDEIKIEHTLFALPFAYAGALLARGGIPPWSSLFWITVAVAGARHAISLELARMIVVLAPAGDSNDKAAVA